MKFESASPLMEELNSIFHKLFPNGLVKVREMNASRSLIVRVKSAKSSFLSIGRSSRNSC